MGGDMMETEHTRPAADAPRPWPDFVARSWLHQGAPWFTACDRVLLVGEHNPQYPDDPAYALHNAPRDKSVAGDLVRPDAPYDVIVLLGRKVQTTFTKGLKHPPLEWRKFARHGVEKWCDVDPVRHAISSQLFDVIALPHPSGLCRDWNDPAAKHRARAVLAEVAPDVPWGCAGDDL